MSAPFRLETAASGMQILFVPRAGTEAATVSFLFRGGSRYETPETNGIAHFNEHMAFKGGKKYPDYKAVTHAFDKLGAVSNAFTGAEVTGFWAKVGASHVPEIADIFSDVLTATAYDPKELNRERGVIIEEINMYEDDPASSIYMELEAATYPGHPLGRSTLGPKKNIKRFTPDDFRSYERAHQTPDRALLVVSGKVGRLKAADLGQYLDRFEGSSDRKPDSPDIAQAKPNLRVKHKATEQTHLGVALRAPALSDRERTPVLYLLAQVLGGTMSSRLFTEVRERQGLAYYVRAAADQYVDTGNLVITAGVRQEKAAQALTAILKEVKRLAAGDLPDAELAMHKDSLLGRLALKWEDSMALADYYGEQQLLLGEVRTTDDWLRALEETTKERIAELAAELAQDTGLNAAVIGPHRSAEFKSTLSFG